MGILDVNFEHWGSSDHYYKGAWVLQTLRSALGNDEMWFDLIKSIHKNWEKSTVTTPEIVEFINKKTKQDFSKFFEQYLYHPNIPKLLYRIQQDGNDIKMSAIWETDVKEFEMPILVGDPENYQKIVPSNLKQEFTIKDVSIEKFRVAEELFLIKSVEL